MEKKEIMKLIIKISMLAIFLTAVVFISIKFAPFVFKLTKDAKAFKEYVLTYKSYGLLIYIFIQILHVIIVFIPGEIVQPIGGYVYGVFFGTLYTMTGMFIGIVIVFMLTKLFGYPLIKYLVPKDKLDKFIVLFNGPRAEIVMFVLFLIPFMPKDALTYIAGLTPIKPVKFLVLCTIARLPGIIVSSFIGAGIEAENYRSVGVVIGIAVILFITGMIFQNRIVDFLHKLREPKDKS